MRRGGFDPQGRREAQEAFRILYRSGLATGAALARLREEFGEGSVGHRIAAFIERTKRGIVAGAVESREPAGADLAEDVR